MKLLINDANILIDIIKLDMVAPFLDLSFDLQTTDFVFSELSDAQQLLLESEKLKIITTDSPEDFRQINSLLANNNGLSFEDCSVWYYTKKLSGVLISGDGKLRKKVREDGIEVKGIIFIIEEMKKQGKITTQNAIIKLNELKELNIRLPHNEIDKIINFWKAE
jgi:predicted nucleic acid-binding protein